MPAPRQMAAYSQTVYECSPLKRGDPTAVTGAAPAPGNPIPSKVGEPSPIRYVVYVIKENRTYDQVFGDMKQGNGDPNLCLFPEAITPNHHALVSEFVLLDNFYVESEVSADGHEWTMGAYATDFVERLWPLGYRGDRRVPYPAEGAHDEAARPAGGYLWDKAAAKGVSYRSYGEFVANGRTAADPGTASVKALEGHFDPMFRSFDMDYPDVKRTDRFLEELAGVRESRRDAAAVDRPASERPHVRNIARQMDRDGLRGRQRPGARAPGRGPLQEPLLEANGHLRGRRRRAERLGPRRRPPDGRPGHQPVISSDIRSIRRCTARRRCCARWS